MLDYTALEQQIEAQMHSGRVPGLALAIVHDHALIYARGFGVANAEEHGAPITPQTLFRIASLTKPLTGTLIMRLVEAGQLDLDRPVNHYIPWLRLSDPQAAGRITLRMLLCHTAGLPRAYEPSGRRTPDGLAAYVRDDIPQYPLVAPPGTVHAYSNAGISLAGYIAEFVCERPYDALMRELVLGPLAMGQTFFDARLAMRYPTAQPHILRPDGTPGVDRRDHQNTGQHPAYFAYSTVTDLANVAIMYLQEGRLQHQQLLAPATVAAMLTPQTDLYTLDDMGYGLTFYTGVHRGYRWAGHGGTFGAFVGRLVLMPGTGAAVIVLASRRSNALPLNGLVFQILEELLDLPAATALPPPMAPDRSAWPRYTGVYVGYGTGVASVQATNDQLTLNHNGTLVALCIHRQDLYYHQPEDGGEALSIGFVPAPERPTEHVLINGSVYRRIEVGGGASAPSTWEAYTGLYDGDHDTLEVFLEDERLMIYSEMLGDSMPCLPLDAHRFGFAWGIIVFELGDAGGPATCTLLRTPDQIDGEIFTRLDEDQT